MIRESASDEMRARIERVRVLIQEAYDLVDEAIDTHLEDKNLAAVAILYSGGNDSTTLAHLFRRRATHAIHCNTGIGIEATRQFVRDTCATWGLPLIEAKPAPGRGYRDLVLGETRSLKDDTRIVWSGGFPGPAAHSVMYRYLKERSLDQARRELIGNPRFERAVFLAGIRREESRRRMNVPDMERRGSIIYVSPLVNWTKLDLNTYRMMYPVPRNEVSDKLHMSGECLCGAFAKPGELDHLGFWFPEMKREIQALECEALAKGTIPAERCRWGWGAGKEKPSASGLMCSSCDAGYEEAA